MIDSKPNTSKRMEPDTSKRMEPDTSKRMEPNASKRMEPDTSKRMEPDPVEPGSAGSKLTPMMQQYWSVKERHQDSLLFFRLGDFYEMFFEDAVTASRELEITLTGRDCGMDERAPMCGVPYHAAQGYISRLIQKGYKVAICDQMEDPALAKGIVRRDVTRVITPGTITEPGMLEEKRNNFILAIHHRGGCYGIAAADVTTGEFYATQITWGNAARRVVDEIARYRPAELLVEADLPEDPALMRPIRDHLNLRTTPVSEWVSDPSAVAARVKPFFDQFQKDWELARTASGLLLGYLEETQKSSQTAMNRITCYTLEQYMAIDSASRRNLELTETMREGKKKGSLLWVLDRTATSMGGRTLRKWLEQPLLETGDIRARLDAVAELKDRFIVRSELMDMLRGVYDLERLSGRLTSGIANARDLLSIAASAEKLPAILAAMNPLNADMLCQVRQDALDLGGIRAAITDGISPDAPLGLKEGGLIHGGYDETVDELRRARTEGKDWIAAMEAREREKTGVRSLKIRYNDNFGYYIEITKANAGQVPEEYVRKQTLVNCERFTTPELKHLEDIILGAEHRIVQLEYDLFCRIREQIAGCADEIRQTAGALAVLDAFLSLAETADRENYCRPEMSDDGSIRILGGRHPVIEKLLSGERFVPNDTLLDLDENRTLVITGPNMAGKSTFMRQVAVITLMAQMGSFVPAESAAIGVTDRIFTRVGASDDLASGQSTFMVEMAEMANILGNATPKSLLILDEIGRGTSTYDGLAIAWAVIEAINDRVRLGARTLFATHYHELTELENRMHGVRNYCVTVRRKGEDIVFLHKIERGGADESYGIEVARLAGIPDPVIRRAHMLLDELDDADIIRHGGRKKVKRQVEGQLDLTASISLTKAEQEVLAELRAFDPSAVTPLDALNQLYGLHQKLK